MARQGELITTIFGKMMASFSMCTHMLLPRHLNFYIQVSNEANKNFSMLISLERRINLENIRDCFSSK